MSSIQFTVIGTPKPQARPRVVKRGKFASAYSPKTPWRKAVTEAALKQKEAGYYFDEALSVSIVYYFARPKSHFGTGKNKYKIKDQYYNNPFHTKRPDIDNLNKAVLDAIGDAGLWKDDSLIWYLDTRKVYIDDLSEQERATIYIY
jgi:crossover junction endodeoxyribonuclease RusA